MASLYKIKDINYHPSLVTVDEPTEKRMYLYRVIISYPGRRDTTVYVLSYSDKAAESMARCFMGCGEWETKEELRKYIVTDVCQLDFAIQGWGNNKF